MDLNMEEEYSEEYSEVLGLDEAILDSLKLQPVEEEQPVNDRTKRLLQSVLLVGGTSNIRGIGELMQERYLNNIFFLEF